MVANNRRLVWVELIAGAGDVLDHQPAIEAEALGRLRVAGRAAADRRVRRGRVEFSGQSVRARSGRFDRSSDSEVDASTLYRDLENYNLDRHDEE